jgi:hypothetical protein
MNKKEKMVSTTTTQGLTTSETLFYFFEIVLQVLESQMLEQWRAKQLRKK